MNFKMYSVSTITGREVGGNIESLEGLKRLGWSDELINRAERNLLATGHFYDYFGGNRSIHLVSTDFRYVSMPLAFIAKAEDTHGRKED